MALGRTRANGRLRSFPNIGFILCPGGQEGPRDLRLAGRVLELWPPVRSDVSGAGCISESTALQSLLSAYAGVAQLVERHVANVQVDGSNPFTRSNLDF